MDFIGCYEATREAINHARNEGPVLLEMKVERFMSHTTDDDDRRYRPAEEVEQARLRDPIVSLGNLLLEKRHPDSRGSSTQRPPMPSTPLTPPPTPPT